MTAPKEETALSETNPNPAPNDSPATPPADAPAVTETVSGDAAAPQGTKKKRKRKRKRKSAASGEVSQVSANSGAAPVDGARAAAPTSHEQTAPRTPKGARKDNGPRGNNKRRPEPPHRHRRDAERGLRTQEQLASWRWVPNAAQANYFPAPPPRPTPTPSEVAPSEVAPSEVAPTNEVASELEAGREPPVVPDALAAVPGDATSGDANLTEHDTATRPDPADAASSVQAGSGEPVSHHEPRPRDASPPRWAVPHDAQLQTWFSEALAHFPEPERASLVVSLCSHRAFRQRAGQLEQPGIRSLVAVYDAVFLDAAPSVATVDAQTSDPNAVDPREELRRGLAAVCQGTAEIVRSWPLAARERLIELAEGFELDGALQQDAPRLFFDAPKLVGRLGLRAVCDALSQGHDAEAKELIKTLGARPGVPGLLPMLAEALEGQRFGSLVILSYGGAQSRGPDAKAPKRHSGFCLESQRDVWIRTGESPEAAAFEHYSQVHRRALLPGVAGLYSFGVTRSRKPYAAVLRKGISLQRKLGHGWGLTRLGAVGLATELTLLASGLCRAGVRLPDLDARRFELDDEGRVWLSDLWGAELVEARAQDTQAVSVCRETVVHLLANQPGFTLPPDWREVLSHSADFETIVATLRKLEKSRFWRS